jgi:hypothetical protein
VPSDVRTFRDLDTFVGDAGAKAGLTQAFPFVVTGKPELIDFHIVDAKPDTPSGKIQIPFEVHRQEATFVGFNTRESSCRWAQKFTSTSKRRTIKHPATCRLSTWGRVA